MFTDEEWERLQQFSAYKEEYKYSGFEKSVFWFCLMLVIYMLVRSVF